MTHGMNNSKNSRPDPKIVLLLLFVLVSGGILTWLQAKSANNNLRSTLLTGARIAAHSINIENILSLSGSGQDLAKPAYQRIKTQLALIRNANPQCRFLYLMGQQSDNTVFFFVDSLPVESSNYASPGMVYEEISTSYLQTFDSKKEAVVGPVTDRWGTLITALVPLVDSKTNTLIAVLGMDVDAANWNKQIIGRCWLSVSSMLFLMTVIIVLASRKQIKRARQESEDKLFVLLRSIGNGVIATEVENKIVMINRMAETLTGWRQEEAVGQSVQKVFSFINSETGKQIDHQLPQKALLNQEEVSETHGILTSRDGTEYQVATTATSIIDPDGNTTGMSFVFRDVSERKIAEGRTIRLNQLREDLLGMEKLEKQLTHITDAVIDIFNVDFCRIWIIKPSDLCHRGCPHATVTEGPHVCRERDRCLHLAASSGRYAGLDSKMHGRVPFGCYKIGMIASGDIKDFCTDDITNDPRVHNHEWARQLGLVSCAGIRLLSEKGTPLGVLALFSKRAIESSEIDFLTGLATNISQVVHMDKIKDEKLKLESQLQQSQKMEAIGTLAGGIAHDFNNILGAIIGYTEMARDDSPAKSSVAQDLDKVLEASERAADLVKQILSFSRQDETEYILLQPANVVNKAITLLLPTLPATIEITQDIDTETGLIFADPTQIHQILINLSANACHAMEETGGTLDISLKELDLSRDSITYESHFDSGSFIQLSVSDSGPGMTQEVRNKIFDPYFTTKGVGKGTGMGLSIVHGIIKNYGGFITLSSDPGKGTTFHIFIPVIDKEVLPNLEAIKLIPVGKEKILFIDDEEILADMGKNMLERLGYHVTVRKSSLEALETFRNQHDQFDIVITDQTMPGMTGVDLAKRMLQIRPDIPIILCSGYSSVISEDKAKSMGIREFAMKPLSKKDISQLIRKVLDKTR